MKKILLLVALFGCVASAYSQEFKAKLANDKNHKVTIEIDGGDVKIEGHNGDDVVIQASSTYEVPPEAKGLKPLYSSAVENTGIGLAVTSDSGGLRIEKAVRKAINYTIKLPHNVAVLYQQTNWQASSLTITNVNGDLEVTTKNGHINLTNVTGPIVANTTNGEIRVIFSSLSQAKPSALSTINGSIDLTMPATTKASLKLRTINGAMFTDFDLGMKSPKDGLTKVGGSNNVEGNTNGGGVEMQAHTINSNIYIRKQK